MFSRKCLPVKSLIIVATGLLGLQSAQAQSTHNPNLVQWESQTQEVNILGNPVFDSEDLIIEFDRSMGYVDIMAPDITPDMIPEQAGRKMRVLFTKSESGRLLKHMAGQQTYTYETRYIDYLLRTSPKPATVNTNQETGLLELVIPRPVSRYQSGSWQETFGDTVETVAQVNVEFVIGRSEQWLLNIYDIQLVLQSESGAEKVVQIFATGQERNPAINDIRSLLRVSRTVQEMLPETGSLSELIEATQAASFQ